MAHVAIEVNAAQAAFDVAFFLQRARQDANRKAEGREADSNFVDGLRVGHCTAIAELCFDSQVGLDAQGALNEFRFLRHYATRQHLRLMGVQHV